MIQIARHILKFKLSQYVSHTYCAIHHLYASICRCNYKKKYFCSYPLVFLMVFQSLPFPGNNKKMCMTHLVCTEAFTKFGSSLLRTVPEYGLLTVFLRVVPRCIKTQLYSLIWAKLEILWRNYFSCFPSNVLQILCIGSW